SKISEHLQENIVIDAPLLFEAGLEKYCDITIGIVADDDIRAYRVSQRDNLDIEEARIRIMSQKDKQFYIDKCNYIIENNSSLGVLEANFKELSKIIGE
ncbi:MAG: dephospho-CoA kinase, partial [Clostridia bacterium]|nr:dephospho-CoA kinase [Clostridia bacterium]